MLEVFLKSPGIIFIKAGGSVIRTPVKFFIKESERQLYESLIRVSSITDFEIKKVENVPKEEKKETQKLSITKPKLGVSMDLKIQN